MSDDAIDFSVVPFPDIVETLAFADILAAHRAEVLAVDAGLEEAFNFESDPASALTQAYSYREMWVRARINAASKAIMLPYATGNDLDNLAANVNLLRIENETDTQLRLRTVLAWEGITTAGPKASYKFHALKAVYDFTDVDGNEWQERVIDILVESVKPGIVDIYVLSSNEELVSGDPLATPPNQAIGYDGSSWGVQILFAGGYSINATLMRVDYVRSDILSGTKIHFPTGGIFTLNTDTLAGGRALHGLLEEASVNDKERAGLLSAVDQAVNDEDVRPLCDTVRVYSADIEQYSIVADVYIPSGPSVEITEGAITDLLQEFGDDNYKLGNHIYVTAIYGVFHRLGISRVVLNSPGITSDMTQTSKQAPFLEAITLNLIQE